MKKGMLKGQRRKLLFTVIFIMILTVSLNMIAFIWFQLRVYHMTFQQEFVDMKQKRILLYGDMENECEKHYSLDRIHPSEMVKAGYICEEGLTQYEKLYFSIMEEKECEPVVLPVQYGGKRGWIRSRTIINGKEKNKKIIGVLENYDEQKEKEAEIEHHLKNINKIQKASQRDFLTGVYNREGLIQNIEKALKEDKNKQGVDAFSFWIWIILRKSMIFWGMEQGIRYCKTPQRFLINVFEKKIL